MRNLLLAGSILLLVPAIAVRGDEGQCKLDGYDQAPPPKITGTTDETAESHFGWGTDADPYDSGSDQVWNYVQNLKDKTLSLTWAKGDMLIPFDHPLDPDGISCSRKFGAKNGFERDTDAPIQTSNEQPKGAQAYVAAAGAKSSTSGVELSGDYADKDGNHHSLLVRLILHYLASDHVLRIEFSSGEARLLLGFATDTLGVNQESLVEGIQGADAKVLASGPLSRLVRLNPMSQSFLAVSEDRPFIVVAAPSTVSVQLHADEPPKGETPVVVIDLDGSVVRATHLDLDQLQQEQ